MTHLSGNFEVWGANGPSYPGEGLHATEWFFDLDAGLTSGKDVTYIDYQRSGVRTAIRKTTPGEEIYINGARGGLSYGSSELWERSACAAET